MKTEIAKEPRNVKPGEVKNTRRDETHTNKKSSSLDSDSRKSTKNPKIKDIGKENAQSLSQEKSGDENQTDSNKRGRLKNLAGFWSTAQDDGKVYRKKRLQIDETSAPNASSQEDAPLLISRRVHVEENPAEKPKPVEVVDPGYAKNMASMFQNRPKSASETKKQVRLDIEGTEVDSSGNQEPPNSVKLKRRIKDLAGTFMSRSRDEEPTESDVNTVRSSDQKPVDPILESCRTKGLAGRWNQQKIEQKSADSDSEGEGSSGAEDAKKSKQAWWLVELEAARQDESRGVFENEPEVRDDVIRADDEQPDVISAKITRKTRQLWSTIDQEKKKQKEIEAKIAAEKAAEKAEKERIAAEKAERERRAAEKAEEERIAAEKAEKERIAAEKAAEKAEKERIAKEKAENERIAAEKAAAKKAEKERIAKEKAAAKTRKDSDSNSPAVTDSIMNQAAGDSNESHKLSDNLQDTNNKPTGDDANRCEKVSKRSSERSPDNKSDDNSIVKTMMSKLPDTEDDWIGESGLMLTNASLLHVPRGKPLRGYVD